MSDEGLSDWERLLAAERHLQAVLLSEVTERLGAAQPVDAARVDLASYRDLKAPWNDWHHVATRGRVWARVLADVLLADRGEKDAPL